jgi:GT2 family glycosyltransferase
MRISIIITTYNRAALLESTLQALRAQRYLPGDEVIVVDNGSSDATPTVIERAAAGFPVALRQIHETIPGKTAALMAGTRTAAGDVLALTDDDVLVDADWLTTIRRLFGDPSMALVGGRVDPLWERPAPSWLHLDHAGGRYGPMCSPLALLHYGDAQELGPRTAVGANMVVRRDVLEALGGMRADLGRRRGTLLCGEDHDLCQRAVAAGFRCEYRPELRVRHWVPAGRTRFRYFLRWFFWSGITQALLEAPTTDGTSVSAHRHFLKQLILSSLRAAGRLVAGRRREAVEEAMDAAFAAGYLYQRMKLLTRRTSGAEPRAADAAAARQRAGVHG